MSDDEKKLRVRAAPARRRTPSPSLPTPSPAVTPEPEEEEATVEAPKLEVPPVEVPPPVAGPAGPELFRLTSQLGRLNVLKEWATEVTEWTPDSCSSEAVQARLKTLDAHWDRFAAMHERLGEGCSPALLTHTYVVDDVYAQAYRLYLATQTKLAELLNLLESKRARASRDDNTRRLLPEITLPKFSGDYAEWVPFRDLFTSLVARNNSISDVERMHYLRTSLSGSAHQLVSNLPISDDSFNSAWEILVSRFDNRRLLISSHLDTLTGHKAIAPRSSRDLNDLLTTTTESLSALSALGAPVDHWDHLVVHLLTRRLDSSIREAWEVHLGSSQEYPSLDRLRKFLTGRARALETIEGSSSGRSSSSTQPGRSVAQRLTVHQAPVRAQAATTTTAGFPCAVCKAAHYIVVCPRFRQMSMQARRELVVRQQLCFNCLGNHSARLCQSAKRCQECGNKHHTMIHTEGGPTVPRVSATAPSPLPGPSRAPARYTPDSDSTNSASGQALLITTDGFSQRVRMLIDPGSELSFISEQLVKQLRIRRQHSSIPILGIGSTPSGRTRGVVSCRLQSLHSTEAISIHAYVLSKLLTTLPSFSAADQGWPFLGKLTLADPDYLTPRPVDLVLGADSYGLLLKPGVVKGALQPLVAQHTVFGWVVSGPLGGTPASASYSQSATTQQESDELHDILTRFWVQEEVPTSPAAQLTPEEADCESHFVATHSRTSDGRYVVRLPLKSSTGLLGDSSSTAHRCLQRLLRRLSSDGAYNELYSGFLREYEEMAHMARAPNSSSRRSPVYYLPHHGVLKEAGGVAKLRVVFNGSSLTSSGHSLNDIMHTGAKIQKDITDVLLWVRRHRYIFATDISKMFRQILVHPADQDLQRILWVDENHATVPYRLTTVTYGTRSAPFLAVRVLLQLVVDEGHRYPAAVRPLLNGRYVDDIFGGSDELSDLIDQAEQLIGICRAGGFPLSKWQANHREFFSRTSLQGSSADAHTFEDTSAKILGLFWHPHSDRFRFSSGASSPGSSLTKRIILSEIARIFDPLGLLAPVIVRAKMLLQELWLERLGWDSPLSSPITQRWLQLREELTGVSTIKVPRWIGLTPRSSVEIHGFSDASQLAMAAAVYLKVTSAERGTRVTLLCAKTKVAPLKRLTIPRLELAAALLLTKLTRYAQDTLELTHIEPHLWTDSSVALFWIKSHPARWKDFVRNRVSSIQEILPGGQWHHVPGSENPADCASRGLTTTQLEQHQLWWNGPPWVGKSADHWPAQLTGSTLTCAQEERPGLTLLASTVTHPQSSWDLLTRYSSLTRLLRITSWCFKFVSALKRLPQDSPSDLLTPADLEKSRLHWIAATQAEYFAAELKLISSSQQLPRSHPLTRLTAFIDQRGILRVGGRLKHSNLDPECKHPAILPRDSPLTRLLIADTHRRMLHGGTQLTLAQLRREYWIIGGRAPVRSHILRCMRCARQRGVRAQQLMGQLPHTRVTPSRPFFNSGVDYAGPITLLTWRGRGAKSQKGWLCIFTCFSTSAVHIEAVTDYSTDGFIAAYRRFTARRGICHSMYSDCGTNFVGADASLKKIFTAGTQEFHHLAHLLTNDGTTWKFNPPAAPHMGGKWEAAVKSVKHHLRRVIGEAALTYEEFTTLLHQIEAVLNSRPLEPLSDDPDDLSALTPGHFLIGAPLTTLPEPSLTLIKESRLSRWQLIQQKLQLFWARWSSGYLQRQQSISKWHHPSNEIKVGSLVLLTDERFPPAKWPLARVTALHPGQDGLTRVVTIRTASTTLTRPLAKLAVLPDHSSAATSEY